MVQGTTLNKLQRWNALYLRLKIGRSNVQNSPGNHMARWFHVAGSTFGKFAESSSDCVDFAVRSAKDAGLTWKRKSAFERGQLLRKSAEIIRVIIKFRMMTMNTEGPRSWREGYPENKHLA